MGMSNQKNQTCDMSHAHQESTKNASCLVEPSKPMNFLKTSKPVSFRHQKHSNLGIWVNFIIFGICPQPRNLGNTPPSWDGFVTDFLGRSTKRLPSEATVLRRNPDLFYMIPYGNGIWSISSGAEYLPWTVLVGEKTGFSHSELYHISSLI